MSREGIPDREHRQRPWGIASLPKVSKRLEWRQAGKEGVGEEVLRDRQDTYRRRLTGPMGSSCRGG